MNIRITTGCFALALLLAGCGGNESDLNAVAANTAAPLTQIPAPNNGSWTDVVEATPQGGIRIGNPDAPVKLVEYASLTCPHCKDFTDNAAAPLTNTYVRSGQVSWEFRNFVMNAPDMAMSVLARCQPLTAFFPTIEQIYSQQQEILQRAGQLDEAEQRRLQSLPPEQLMAPLARAMGLDTFFARRGLPETRFNQCLANTQAVQQLSDGTNRAMTEDQVQGTPTFFINGERQEGNTWPAIEQRLRAAIGG